MPRPRLVRALQRAARMRALSIVLLLVATTAHAQEKDGTDTAQAHAHAWDMALAAGVSNTTYAMPGMQLLGTAARSTMSSSSGVELEPTMLFSLRYRVTRRVLWSIPTLSFAYLGGTTGAREWIPWAGLTSWGLGYSSIEHLIASGNVGAGLALREWVSPATAINVTATAASAFQYRGAPVCAAGEMCPSWQPPTTWVVAASAGVSQRIGDALWINLGGGAARDIAGDGSTSISFGSVQAVGLRQLPLLQAQVSKRWFLDGYATATYDLTRTRVEQRYLLGFTRVWSN